MTSGFGTSGAGTSDLGYGTATAAVVPAPAPESFSRKFDPATGDYVINETGDGYETVSTLAQQVTMALATPYGSMATNPTFGFRKPAKLGDDYEREVEVEVRRCLGHLANLEVLSVRTTRNVSSQRIDCVVQFRDIRSGRVDSSEVSIS